MNWKQIKWRMQFAWQYFPFTLNTLLCALAIWGADKLLNKPVAKGEAPSPLMPFILLMGKLVFWFVVGLVGLSILSTFLCYLYFLYLKSKKGFRLQVDFNVETRKGKKNRLFLNARLEGAIRPLLGFIKGRLFYDDNQMTGKFSLLSNKKKEQSIWRKAVTGKSQLDLPDIKEYDLKGGFVYFQDMLHIFSLASGKKW